MGSRKEAGKRIRKPERKQNENRVNAERKRNKTEQNQRALEYGNAISALKNTIPGDLLCTDLKEIQGIIKEHKSTGRIAEMDR